MIKNLENGNVRTQWFCFAIGMVVIIIAFVVADRFGLKIQ